jgi:hypothetical protein
VHVLVDSKGELVLEIVEQSSNHEKKTKKPEDIEA